LPQFLLKQCGEPSGFAESIQQVYSRHETLHQCCALLIAMRSLIALQMKFIPLNVIRCNFGLSFRCQAALMVSATCLLCSGCALCANLARTAIIQPVQYCNYLDEKHQQHQFRALAEEALAQERATARAELDDYTCEPFTGDEECGFVDGYVDQLIYGGDGNAPPLPPRRYWKIKYQNPAGFQAIEDWFKGYRHGAVVARASGYRDYVTIPANDSLTKETLPVYNTGMPLENPPGQFDFSPIGKATDKSGITPAHMIRSLPPLPSTDELDGQAGEVKLSADGAHP
jgi:hypothetical protein